MENNIREVYGQLFIDKDRRFIQQIFIQKKDIYGERNTIQEKQRIYITKDNNASNGLYLVAEN